MSNKKSGQTIVSIVVSLLLLASIIFVSTSRESLPLFPLILVLAPIVFVITFVNTDVALILLIFSMLFSPEFKLIDVPQRSVVFRIDDILLILVFFSWLAKTAINKELGLFRRTSLNSLILAYIVICILSTAIGILTGNISLSKSFFYILKYIEYFMLYFLVTNNIRDAKQVKTFIAAILITCALTCAYAISTVTLEGLLRATAPFEGAQSEPNTLGGYLVLLFPVTAGVFLYSPSRRWRICSGGLVFFIYFTLLHTLSRGSYLAFIFTYLTLTILTRKKRILLIGLLILGIFMIPATLPKKVTARIEKTFVPGVIYEPLGREVALDTSAASRVESWKRVFGQWTRRPFLGYGVTGVGLVDTQYPLVLGETGIVGFFIFIWLLMTILRHSLYIFNNIDDDWSRGISLGFLAGFIGLLVHGFAANTFIIVRIMEPFWFLAAIVIVLPQIQKEQDESLGYVGSTNYGTKK
jgi:hypothetical protein